MQNHTHTHDPPGADPVYVVANAVNTLIHTLPAGTAYFIGIVLVVMLTGRLSETKGSLARAAFPLVAHLQWGWRLVEQAMERGKLSLDALFDTMLVWCKANLEIEEVRLGPLERGVDAIDSSTIARLRAGEKLALAGKGYDHRAGRSVRGNIVAALTTVAMIGTTRVGLLRRVRFGATCEEAVSAIFRDAPEVSMTSLISLLFSANLPYLLSVDETGSGVQPVG